MKLQFSAQIESLKANSDRTVSLRIGTQELSAEDIGKLVEMFEKQIWIALAETTMTAEDLNIPEVIDPLDQKSPSQRLRDRMFVYFKEKRTGKDFDGWYKKCLEDIGQKYLDSIN